MSSGKHQGLIILVKSCYENAWQLVASLLMEFSRLIYAPVIIGSKLPDMTNFPVLIKKPVSTFVTQLSLKAQDAVKFGQIFENL